MVIKCHLMTGFGFVLIRQYKKVKFSTISTNTTPIFYGPLNYHKNRKTIHQTELSKEQTRRKDASHNDIVPWYFLLKHTNLHDCILFWVSEIFVKYHDFLLMLRIVSKFEVITTDSRGILRCKLFKVICKLFHNGYWCDFRNRNNVIANRVARIKM